MLMAKIQSQEPLRDIIIRILITIHIIIYKDIIIQVLIIIMMSLIIYNN